MKDNEPIPPTTLQVHPAASADEQAQLLARHIARRLREAITVRGHAVMAVSGGKSPIAMFEQLRGQTLDWTRVTVVLVDERCVPHDHPESNTALVRQHLLQGRAAAATFVPFFDTLPPTLSAAALNALVVAPTTDSRPSRGPWTWWCWAWAKTVTPPRFFPALRDCRRRCAEAAPSTGCAPRPQPTRD